MMLVSNMYIAMIQIAMLGLRKWVGGGNVEVH